VEDADTRRRGLSLWHKSSEEDTTMDQRRVNRSDDETGIVCPNCGKEMRLKERKPPKRVVIQCPDPLCGVTEERSSAELNL
jgi:ssDNA-binding Zn-finger/Zn-ribbon topoisomerase 1